MCAENRPRQLLLPRLFVFPQDSLFSRRGRSSLSGGFSLNTTKKLLCLLLAILLSVNLVTPALAQSDPPGEETEQSSPPQEDPTGDAEELPPSSESTEPPENPEQPQPGDAPTEPPEEVTEPPGEQAAEEPTQPSQPVPYNPVPRFYQTDYPDVRYGSGTVATSGCSITCVSMVAGWLTGQVYLPDQLAKWFGGKADNYMARMEYACKMLRLPFTKAGTVLDVYAALEDGNIAIVLMNKNSAFTDTQHFIVLCGLTEEGNILVNDPYRPHYDDWRLQRGLTYGFSREDITCGFSGGWIFDPDHIVDPDYLYTEPEPDYANPRYPQISLTAQEWDLLAKVVWVEAQGECFDGQQAVAEAVLNRMASDRFPDDLHSVIYGENQFRSVPYLDKATPNQTQYDAIERALYGPYILAENVFYFYAEPPEGSHIWGTIGGHTFCYS